MREEHIKEREILEIRRRNKWAYILIEDRKVKGVATEIPAIIEIYPHLRCNVNCFFCDRGKEVSVLSDFNDIKILYNKLRKDRLFHLSKFRISGGEPCIYPKINELISFLHTIDHHVKIDFLTNALKLKNLNKHSLELVNIIPSIYPQTQQRLRNDKYVVSLFKSLGIALGVNCLFHQDMRSYGSIRNNFNPSHGCFLPTLVAGTKKVYPCCRAHRLEQDYKKNYHLEICAPNLYKGLNNIITTTDLCTRCPRSYSDCRYVHLRDLYDIEKERYRKYR